MFECILWDRIDVDKSKVVLENCAAAYLTLKKETASRWPKLEADEMSFATVRVYTFCRG